MTTPERAQLYPLLFTPVLKDYIWGGRNLARKLNRTLPDGQNIAESWEIAAHPNGDVRIANGALKNRYLSEVTKEFGTSLIGTKGAWALKRQRFPLLVKLLDATRRLSVQVHPDDQYADANENGELGKTEMWVVLHAEENASIILGVRNGTSSETFRAALRNGTLQEHLHEIPVHTGDFVCVPSGTLHAILGGLLIAEVQQSSDITYRVYDWDRVGADGTPRDLHIEEAMEVINFDQLEPRLPSAVFVEEQSNGIKRWELCRNPYFVVERVEMPTFTAFDDSCNGESLQIWGLLDGAAFLTGGMQEILLDPVTFTLLPAQLGPYQIACGELPACLLRIYLH